MDPSSTPPVSSANPSCPQCHAAVRATDYFCYNCGKNLKPAPPATNFETLTKLYLGAILLPPMGIIWGWKYLKGDAKSKMHGYILIALTILELVYLTIWTVNFVKQINSSVNQQMNGLQGF